MLVELAGHRVLTDPLLTRRVAHLRRRRPVPSGDIVDVDVVLVTHAHMDHLHLASLRRLRPGYSAVVPAGLAPLVRRSGAGHVVEVVPGDRVGVGPVHVEATRAAHGHGRGPHSRHGGRPVGYVIASGSVRVYVAGDTDLFAGMAELGPVDVAALPIWGWGPTIGAGHLDPVRAAEAVSIIRPSLVLPMHWGTYTPEDGRRRLPSWFERPIVEFEEQLAARGELHRAAFVEPGGRVRVESGPDTLQAVAAADHPSPDTSSSRRDRRP